MSDDDQPGSGGAAAPATFEMLGWSDRWEALATDAAAGEPGRVLRHDGTAVLVGTASGTEHFLLRATTPPVAVGDWVIVGPDAVEGVLPRSSLLARRDPSTGGAQPIAANVDIVGIVCGLDRPVKLGRVRRFATLAWDAGATPLVILSKADLVEDVAAITDEIITAIPGVDVIAVSAAKADGMSALLERCVDTTLVLVGESGAGKSTLVNALAGHEATRTSEVRTGDHKGRHTTTARQLHLLNGPVRLIDTPGVREVGIVADVDTVDAGFADIAELALDCRFGDCAHTTEPGCAVRAAVEEGELSAERLGAWEELRREAASAELRADPAAHRRADRRLGRVYREVKEMKRRNR
ncbi:MAG: ribosome small subunit-dependent GTPase A [Acidimicrobiales bacterium]